MKRILLRGRVLGAAIPSFLLAMASCSSDDGAGNNGGGGGFNTGGSSGSGTGGNGGSAFACRSASDCTGGQVCHPVSQECVNPGGSCETHADCDPAMYCDNASSTCLPGTTGSPCAGDENCMNATCVSNVCGCSGLSQEQELIGGNLDIYFIFDRTASMGEDCSYQAGQTPPVNSKACFATYALSDYLINANPTVDTRLAFQFMSLADNDCDGALYSTPLVGLTQLPITADHAIIQNISNETFVGGFGTHIEGALRGMSQYTANNRTPGREMIGVLMTDGDPNGCEENIGTLSQIISDHLAATGIRTFIIGMEGATDSNLEELGLAGGADAHNEWCGSVQAPCHYWNVEDGSGDAIANALEEIIGQAAPLPCEYDVVTLTPPPGETLDFSKINVTLTDPNDVPTTIGQVPSPSDCPTDVPAWYYDNPGAPTTINLCENACDLVSQAAGGSRVSVVVGCRSTVILR